MPRPVTLPVYRQVVELFNEAIVLLAQQKHFYIFILHKLALYLQCRGYNLTRSLINTHCQGDHCVTGAILLLNYNSQLLIFLCANL